MGSVLLLAIIGVAAGFVASKVMKTNLSMWETIAIGVLGAIVGGVILRFVIALSSDDRRLTPSVVPLEIQYGLQ